MFGSTEVITILGKRGSGKSTLGRKIQEAYPRRIIIDRLNEYDENEPGRRTVKTFDDFASELRASVNAPSFEIVFQFDIESTAHDALFDQVLRCSYYRGSALIVLEEVHHFASAHFIPHWFRETILTGRHRRIALIATSQRPAEVHKTLLSQSSHIFAGCLYEKNDVDYLKSFMGEDAFKLASIPQYKFLHYQPGKPSEIIGNQ